MSISDAQFEDWIARQNSQRVILAELDFLYQGVSPPTLSTTYLSQGLYCSAPGDTPASRVYADLIERVPAYTRMLDDSLMGRARVSLSSLELSNEDGRANYLLDICCIGQRCTMLLGDPSWPRSDFRTVFVAIVSGMRAPSPSKVVVELSDATEAINRRLAGINIGGTGPNAERPRQIIHGYCHNIEALAIDPIGGVYVIGDSTTGVAEVRDAGVSLSTGYPTATDDNGTITIDPNNVDAIYWPGHPFRNFDIVDVSSTGTLPTGLTAGRYWLAKLSEDTYPDQFELRVSRNGAPVALTFMDTFTGDMTLTATGFDDQGAGLVALGPVPYGTITADVYRDVDDDEWRALSPDGGTTDGVLEQLLAHVGMSAFVDYHSTAPDPASTSNPRVGVAILEQTNLLDIIDDLMRSIGCAFSTSRTGNFLVSKIRPSVGDTGVVLDLREDDLIDARLKIVVPPYAQFSVQYNRNWHRQTSGLVGGLPEDLVALYSQPGRVLRGPAPSTTGSYVSAPEAYFRTTAEAPILDSLISDDDVGDAASFAAVRRDDLRLDSAPPVQVIEVDIGLRGFTLEIGDIVRWRIGEDYPGQPERLLFGVIPYPYTGINFQVIGTAIDLASNRVTLTLSGRRDLAYYGITNGDYYA